MILSCYAVALLARNIGYREDRVGFVHVLFFERTIKYRGVTSVLILSLLGHVLTPVALADATAAHPIPAR